MTMARKNETVRFGSGEYRLAKDPFTGLWLLLSSIEKLAQSVLVDLWETVLPTYKTLIEVTGGAIFPPPGSPRPKEEWEFELAVCKWIRRHRLVLPEDLYLASCSANLSDFLAKPASPIEIHLSPEEEQSARLDWERAPEEYARRQFLRTTK